MKRVEDFHVDEIPERYDYQKDSKPFSRYEIHFPVSYHSTAIKLTHYLKINYEFRILIPENLAFTASNNQC